MAYRRRQLSEDPWFDSDGYGVMPLPAGQGFVIQRRRSGLLSQNAGVA